MRAIDWRCESDDGALDTAFLLGAVDPVTRRLRACLLLVLFLGAGTSLPGADALFHHWRPESFRVHYDPAGGCTSHADHCTLARTPPGSASAAPAGITTRLGFDHWSDPIADRSARPIDARLSLLPPSRAPPGLTI
jgi:hypothetical protein